MPQNSLPPQAVELWSDVLQRAQQCGMNEPTAVALATVDEEGLPDARIVLVRGWDEQGFCFFTNYQSAKAQQLDARPAAALCFYWDPLHEQVRVRGRVQRTNAAESDEYWNRRPRGSRIGAWASLQSQSLSDREELERRVAEFDTRYADQEPPRPEFWGGYRLLPTRIEFWRGRPSRLHDRLVFERTEQGWKTRKLYP